MRSMFQCFGGLRRGCLRRGVSVKLASAHELTRCKADNQLSDPVVEARAMKGPVLIVNSRIDNFIGKFIFIQFQSCHTSLMQGLKKNVAAHWDQSSSLPR